MCKKNMNQRKSDPQYILRIEVSQIMYIDSQKKNNKKKNNNNNQLTMV